MKFFLPPLPAPAIIVALALCGGAARGIKGGTPVAPAVGDTGIPAAPKDCKASRDLISPPPYRMTPRRYARDCRRVMSDPPEYDEAGVRCVRRNGDIDFAAGGDYLTILYKDGGIFQRFGRRVNLGVINGPLPLMDTPASGVEIIISASAAGFRADRKRVL